MLVPLTSAEAVSLVSKWHYSGTASAGVARFGWEVDGEVVGASIFDNGVHDMRKGVFGEDHFRHVLHHHRLALHPDAPHLTASRFIAASLRALPDDIWAVVTYADLCQGHRGTIYQATNAIYTGMSAKGNLKFRKPDGTLATTQGLSGTWPERRVQAAERGWTEVRCLGKHRYVYLLGTKVQRRYRPPLQWPTLPYPKEAQ